MLTISKGHLAGALPGLTTSSDTFQGALFL